MKELVQCKVPRRERTDKRTFMDYRMSSRICTMAIPTAIWPLFSSSRIRLQIWILHFLPPDFQILGKASRCSGARVSPGWAQRAQRLMGQFSTCPGQMASRAKPTKTDDGCITEMLPILNVLSVCSTAVFCYFQTFPETAICDCSWRTEPRICIIHALCVAQALMLQD